jgi:hypothetical protein
VSTTPHQPHQQHPTQGTHETTDPPPLGRLPAIPDNPDHLAVVLGLLKAGGAGRLLAELDREVERQARMGNSSLARIRDVPASMLLSMLRNTVPQLVRAERARRKYRLRRAALGGPADEDGVGVAEAVAAGIRDVRDVSEAIGRIHEHESIRLAKVESRILAMLHASTQERTSIGPFHQDVFIDDLTAAVADRAKIIALSRSKPGDLVALVTFLSPAEQGSP